MAELAAWRTSAPCGRDSEFDKAQKQGEFRVVTRKATMFQAVTRGDRTISYAGMAELADALDSGSSRGSSVKVQVLLPAPNQYNPNHILVTSEWFGFTFYLNELA